MRVFVLLLLWAACLAAPAAPPAAQKAALRVRPRGKTLLLTERGRTHALRVAERVDAARITDARVVFESRAGGFLDLPSAPDESS